jgi:hypothetical protein
MGSHISEDSPHILLDDPAPRQHSLQISEALPIRKLYFFMGGRRHWAYGFAWLGFFPLLGRSRPAQHFHLPKWFIERLSPSRLHPFR